MKKKNRHNADEFAGRDLLVEVIFGESSTSRETEGKV